jgi:hypothetical protein
MTHQYANTRSRVRPQSSQYLLVQFYSHRHDASALEAVQEKLTSFLDSPLLSDNVITPWLRTRLTKAGNDLTASASVSATAVQNTTALV